MGLHSTYRVNLDDRYIEVDVSADKFAKNLWILDEVRYSVLVSRIIRRGYEDLEDTLDRTFKFSGHMWMELGVLWSIQKEG